MELQTFINSHPNYISEFRKQGFKVNTFKDLKIISYHYDKKPLYESNSDFYKLFLRGAVINKDNKVVCLPPVKSFDLTDTSIISFTDDITEVSVKSNDFTGGKHTTLLSLFMTAPLRNNL